ncbi:MAG: DMT family transporter [Paludibacteraceae bacterium]|nr:DMT family transporter [Bacteroidales bacterium]MDY4148568.1 DMT family transporter [Paludibacteraceae bacterium]
MLHSKSVGYLFGILAAGFYGLNPMFALPLYQDGMDSVSVLFWRYALSVPMLAVLMLCRHIDFRLSKAEAIQIALLGAVMALSSLLLYLSYNYMDAGLASTILFVYPIVTAVLMAFVFHERVAPLVWGCLALASVGIGVLCELNGNTHVSIAGVLLSLGSALTYAIYLVFINKGHITHLPSAKITFYVLLFGSLMLGVLLLCRWQIAVPQGLHWGYSIGAALFPTALSLVLTTLAIQGIGSTQTAILGAMEPITAVMVGLTLFGEHLTVRSCIGIALIVIAVTIVVARKQPAKTV